VKLLKPVLLVVIIVSIGIGGWFWWQHESLYPSTDDAYIQSDIVSVSALVGGQIASISVAENDYVKAGDPLFTIDAASYRAALEAAEAQLTIAQQSSGASGANVGVAQATLAKAEAALKEADSAFKRDQALLDRGAISPSALDTAQATRDEAMADRDSARAALSAARENSGASGSDNAGVRAAVAAVTNAASNLAYASVSSPTTGWVTHLSLRPGTSVAPMQPLFSIVEDGRWWVEGNFKETDLARIRAGMPVDMTLDMYPDVSLTGVVESISAGSGSSFSLLPAENASGNWVKVTQRYSVRISLTDLPQDPSTPLRVGASTTAVVDPTALATQ